MDGNDATTVFLREHVHEVLSRAPSPAEYWVALSGGCDSTVLLNVIHVLQLRQPVHAVHVHHGLYAEADSWADFCVQLCQTMCIPLTVHHIQAQAPEGHSQEAWARRLRYEALKSLLRRGSMLLTAHHQQDQAETVLLQLLRGGGPAGLAAMPSCAVFGAGWHVRPLLDIPPAVIRTYASDLQLRWIEDHSNMDIRFDRNFLRQRVLPAIAERWPQFGSTLSRAAQWQSEAAETLGHLAEEDLRLVSGGQEGCLSVSKLEHLPAIRQRNVLRAWIAQHRLPPPAATHIEQIRIILNARWDSHACVHWAGAEVRRYRGDLYAMAALSPHDAGQTFEWDPNQPLQLPWGRLTAQRRHGQGISIRATKERPLLVRFRHGGERCRRTLDGPNQMLKKLFQERGVPPWLRERIPLVYTDDQLLAVADWWVCAPYRATAAEEGWLLNWLPAGANQNVAATDATLPGRR